MRRAVVVAADRAGLLQAAERLSAGGNVAFPTETVYGLGGDALNEQAVLRIFAVKGRPLSDPLIVHVLDAESARALVRCVGETRRIFDALAQRFWPGPLTMVLEASECVPRLVTADTGFVGVRAPAHPVARELIRLCGRPVAAPSANRFGHVSPTSAQHVLDDLGASDIVVVDGGDVAAACAVGIESTVLKVVDSRLSCHAAGARRELVLFRKGGVSEASLRAALDQAGFVHVRIVAPPPLALPTPAPAAAPPPLEPQHPPVVSPQRPPVVSPQHPPEHLPSVSAEEAAAAAGNMQAPGQLITHYAPAGMETWVLRRQERGALAGAAAARWLALDELARLPIEQCCVLDFGGALAELRPRVRAYRDLAPDGATDTAARGLFDALRWTEGTGARFVVVQDVSHDAGDLAAGVADRIFRAASGKVVQRLALLT
jgi:L-threonylcarbamoyladenylate synthase